MNGRNLKILFVLNDLGFGGAERTVSYLSDYLCKCGDEVVVGLFKNKVDYDLNGEVGVLCGNISDESTNPVNRVLSIIKRIIFLRKVIHKEKPDLVFFMMASLARYSLYPRFRKYKIIVSERGNPKFLSRKGLRFERKAFKKCDGSIFQTNRVQQFFNDVISTKSVVIPNAVGNEQAVSINWNPSGRKTVSAVGRLVWDKDYPLMIEAFNLFWEKHKDYSLEIYGDGVQKDELKELIASLPSANNIFLMGSSREVVKKISDSDCYITTSIFEGMPNSLIEAMAVGMPCISSNCEYGPAELITDGYNGLLVPVGDVKATAEALTRMIDDPSFAVECGRNARKILEYQNIDVICSRFRDFFESVAFGNE